MSKLRTIIISAIAAAVCFAGGFFEWSYVRSHPILPGTKIYAANENASELLTQYFSDVKFDKQVISGDNSSPIQYTSGNMIIQTDSTGSRVIAIALNADAAKAVEESLSETKRRTDLVIESAESELEKYVDIEYYLDTEIVNEGNFYMVTLTEKNSGRETGAGGYFVYYTNGVLFSATFTERVVDFPADEEIITVEEAYEIAFDAIKEERVDLELNYCFAEENVKIDTAQIGQVYHVEVWGEKDNTKIYCMCTLYATTGEIVEIAYSDY